MFRRVAAGDSLPCSGAAPDGVGAARAAGRVPRAGSMSAGVRPLPKERFDLGALLRRQPRCFTIQHGVCVQLQNSAGEFGDLERRRRTDRAIGRRDQEGEVKQSQCRGEGERVEASGAALCIE